MTSIKTAVPNMAHVARAPSTYPTKICSRELGAQAFFDKKNEYYIVNGVHHALRLQELLDVFFNKLVLRYSCKIPETGRSSHPENSHIRDEDVVRDRKTRGKGTGVE
jgi:hypothetical protein